MKYKFKEEFFSELEKKGAIKKDDCYIIPYIIPAQPAVIIYFNGDIEITGSIGVLEFVEKAMIVKALVDCGWAIEINEEEKENV